MKSKKKIISYIFIGIIFLIIILIILLLTKDNLLNKRLAGNKIINGLYTYSLEDEKNIQDVIIKNNKIYYLINKEDTYILKEINIYTNKIKEIGSVNCDVCILNDYYLSCNKEDLTIIYDINLKQVYKSNNSFNIVPYQDSFLIVDEKDIYLNNKRIRTIKDDIERFDINRYYVKDDNTFIEFISINDLYIYNVKDDSYEKIQFNNLYLYDKGFYYSNKDKIVFHNLDNNEIKEYNNFAGKDFDLSTVKDNIFIYMDNKYLKIYNLDTNKFKYLDYKFENSMDRVVINDNYLYLIYQGNNPNVYVVNLDEFESNEYTKDEYDQMLNGKLLEKAKKLENKYNNVNIVYDTNDLKNDKIRYSEYINENRYEIIDDELNAIDNVLNKLGNEFLSIFKHDEYKGLRIIIVEKIITDKSSAIDNISGQFFATNDYYNIVISKSDMPNEKIFCHEMMHAIDENASSHRYDIAGKWYDYNPKDFNYGVNHYKNDNIEYTTYAYNDKDAYFVDSYSKVNQLEDRARIFENVCYIDGENIIKKYPNLLEKAKYIKDELIKYYPSLNNSKVFDSIK